MLAEEEEAAPQGVSGAPSSSYRLLRLCGVDGRGWDRPLTKQGKKER